MDHPYNDDTTLSDSKDSQRGVDGTLLLLIWMFVLNVAIGCNFVWYFNFPWFLFSVTFDPEDSTSVPAVMSYTKNPSGRKANKKPGFFKKVFTK